MTALAASLRDAFALRHSPIGLLFLMAFGMPIGFSTWLALLNNFTIEVANFSGVEIGWLQTVREIPGFFAVGVIAYECIMGRRPYLGRSRKEIRDAILLKQAQIKDRDIPSGYTKEAADFVNRCLKR